jgi:hypothetical protein
MLRLLSHQNPDGDGTRSEASDPGNKIETFDHKSNATEKSEAIACTCSSRSSRLKGGGHEKNNWKKWRANEEERHKGSLETHTQKNCEKINDNNIYRKTNEKFVCKSHHSVQFFVPQISVVYLLTT